MKKLFAMLLACSMAFTMATTSFAADDTVLEGGESGYEAGTELTGTVETPTIKVTVPATGGVIINPYKLQYNTTPEGDEATYKQDAIISPTQFVVSESNVALSVVVSVEAEIPESSGVLLSTTALKPGGKDKSVYMYFEALPAGEYDEENATFADPVWATAFDKSKHLVVNTVADGGTAPVLDLKDTVIPAATFEEGECTVPTALAFHVVGDACSTATDPWTEADTVNVSVVFTFAPVANTVEADDGGEG